MNRRSLGVIAVSAGLLLVGFFAGSALAQHWLDGTAKKAGDSDVYFKRCNLNDTVQSKFNDNDNHDIDSTQITTHVSNAATTRMSR